MRKMNIHYCVYELYVCKRTTAQYSLETFHWECQERQVERQVRIAEREIDRRVDRIINIYYHCHPNISSRSSGRIGDIDSHQEKDIAVTYGWPHRTFPVQYGILIARCRRKPCRDTDGGHDLAGPFRTVLREMFRLSEREWKSDGKNIEENTKREDEIERREWYLEWERERKREREKKKERKR